MAVLLVAGGIFSFLPVLGLWMLPLGLVLFAQDVPVLQKPMAKVARMDRAQVDRASARKKRAMTRLQAPATIQFSWLLQRMV